MPRSIHLLIKPASGLCNLRCRYCFYCDITQKREQASYGIMSLETLEAVIEKALGAARTECTIAYQGGEPTLAGLDFFRKSIEMQKKHNRRKIAVHNAIQTNGMVIDDEWAKFFAENHFLVGLSIDGTRETHDACRVDPQGEGTYSRVMNTVRLFDRFHVDYNILTVVNRITARRVESIYQQYKKHGFRYLQFIPCLDPLGEEIGGKNYSLTPELFGEFLNRLFRLWHRDMMSGNPVSIRTFDNYLNMLLGNPPECCGMGGVCGVQNVVEADGSVYPCDFYVLDEYHLGNLRTDSFEQIDRRREEIRFIESSREFPAACRECRYFPLCRGGCRRMRSPIEGFEVPMNYFCSAYKSFFDKNLKDLENLAAWVQRGQF